MTGCEKLVILEKLWGKVDVKFFRIKVCRSGVWESLWDLFAHVASTNGLFYSMFWAVKVTKWNQQKGLYVWCSSYKNFNELLNETTEILKKEVSLNRCCSVSTIYQHLQKRVTWEKNVIATWLKFQKAKLRWRLNVTYRACWSSGQEKKQH